MYIRALPPVLEKALAVPQARVIQYIKGIDQGVLQDFLAEKLISNLMASRRTLVVMADDMDLNILAKVMSQHKMGHFVGQWYHDEPFEKSDCDRLKILTQLNKVQRGVHTWDQLKSYVTVQHEKIVTQLRTHEYLLDENSIQKWLAHGNMELSECEREIQEDIRIFEKPEDILPYIDELQKQFNPRFVYQNTNLIENHSFDSLEIFQLVKNQVEILRSSIETILQDFKYLKNELLQNIDNQLNKEIDTWWQVLDEIRYAYFTFDMEEDPDAYAQNLMHILAPTKEHQYIILTDANDRAIYSWGQGHGLIDNIEAIIDQAELTKRQVKSGHFARLTPFNISSESLSSIQKRIADIKEYIDNSEHINILFSDVSLTLVSMEQGLLTLSEQANELFTILNDTEYVEYRLLHQKVGVSDKLIAYFEQQGGQWLLSLKSLIAKSIISDRIKGYQQPLSQRLKQYQEVLDFRSDIIQDVVHNKWHKLRHDALHEFRKNHGELYHSLFESTHTSLNWHNLLYSDPQFLLHYFPVMAIHQSRIESIGTMTNHWDEVVFFETLELRPDHLNNIIENEIPISIVTSRCPDLHHIQKKWMTNNFFSTEQKIVHTEPYTLMNRSDRYHQAQALALSLTSTMSACDIYRVHDLNIISLLDPQLKKKLLLPLFEDQLNILYEDTDDPQHLIEAMIVEDTEIIVFIQNGLVNDARYDSTEWQLHTIDRMKEAHITVIDLDTLQVIRNPEQAVQKVRRQLGTSLMPTESSEKIEINA